MRETFALLKKVEKFTTFGLFGILSVFWAISDSRAATVGSLAQARR